MQGGEGGAEQNRGDSETQRHGLPSPARHGAWDRGGGPAPLCWEEPCAHARVCETP